MSLASTPALFTASLITALPRAAQLISFRLPPKVPMGVLHADTTTTSFMLILLSRNDGFEKNV
jgi:hypothetical protein